MSTKFNQEEIFIILFTIVTVTFILEQQLKLNWIWFSDADATFSSLIYFKKFYNTQTVPVSPA